jgi:hypothetical protein
MFFRNIIDNSRSITDNFRSVIDESRVMLQFVAYLWSSFMIVIFLKYEPQKRLPWRNELHYFGIVKLCLWQRPQVKYLCLDVVLLFFPTSLKTPGACTINLLRSFLLPHRNKLECLSMSLTLTQSNISGQGWSLKEWSPLWYTTLILGF